MKCRMHGIEHYGAGSEQEPCPLCQKTDRIFATLVTLHEILNALIENRMLTPERVTAIQDCTEEFSRMRLAMDEKISRKELHFEIEKALTARKARVDS